MKGKNIESELENIKGDLVKAEDVTADINKVSEDYILFERDTGTYIVASSGVLLKKIIGKHIPICWTPDKRQILVSPKKPGKPPILLNFDYFRSFAARRPSKKSVINQNLDISMPNRFKFSSSGKLTAYITGIDELTLYVSDRRGDYTKKVSERLRADPKFVFSPDDKKIAFDSYSCKTSIFTLSNRCEYLIDELEYPFQKTSNSLASETFVIDTSSAHKYYHNFFLIDWYNSEEVLIATNQHEVLSVSSDKKITNLWKLDNSLLEIEALSLSPNKQYLSCLINSKLFVSGLESQELNFQEISAYNAYNSSWSPDSKKIAYDNGEDIYMTDLKGNNHLIVKNGSNPLWSPSK